MVSLAMYKLHFECAYKALSRWLPCCCLIVFGVSVDASCYQSEPRDTSAVSFVSVREREREKEDEE